MKVLIINNKCQYNHRIGRSLKYLIIPHELHSKDLSLYEIEKKILLV